MPRNGRKQIPKDELVCQLELRQTRSQFALEESEFRRRAIESTLYRFQKLYQNAPIGFVTFDHSGRILDINQSAIRLLQVTPASVVGLAMTVLISSPSVQRFIDHLRRSRRAGGAPVSTEVEMIAGRGGRVHVQLVTSALAMDTGRLFETAIIDLTEQKAAAEVVARAREYAESIVTTIPYPVMVLDHRGRVVSANAAFFYVFQTCEGQVVNWPISQLPDVNWLSPSIEQAVEKTIKDGRPVDSLVVRAEVRRGSILTLNMNARRLVTQPSEGRNQYLLVAFEDITRRQRAEEERELFLAELQESQVRLEVRVKERTHELGKSYGQLRNLGEQLVLAHEQEQRRIARELHDQIGQDLTALKIILSRGKNVGAEQAVKTLKEAEALTEEILQTVRNICGTLRPQVLDDLGLVAGLQWHVKTFSARTGLDVTFDIGPIDESRLSPLVKSTIFRVIQEALTNVSRHAETKTASIMLGTRNGSIEFSVRDGGKGFEPAEAMKKASTGLSSMRERLSLVQGRFEMSSSPGMGAIVRAYIPLPPGSTTTTPTTNQ